MVNGSSRSPSIEEKYALQLEQLKPDLHAYRDDEKARIMERLQDHVEDSSIGIVPKQQLVESVVETDVSDDRWSRRTATQGYDPELVREAYRDLVPAALVEQEIELANTDVEDSKTVTAVRLREDPWPPEYSDIRAQFTAKFGNYAVWEPLYELPDVSEQLQDEPSFAGGQPEPPVPKGNTV